MKYNSILFGDTFQMESTFSFSATATQLTNRLNNLTVCTRSFKNHENLKKSNLNRAQLNSMRSVNLIRVKELKIDTLSSADFLPSKCARRKFKNKTLKQIELFWSMQVYTICNFQCHHRHLHHPIKNQSAFQWPIQMFCDEFY